MQMEADANNNPVRLKGPLSSYTKFGARKRKENGKAYCQRKGKVKDRSGGCYLFNKPGHYLNVYTCTEKW